MSDVVPLLKFTPSAQDPQILETITVQREPLVARLVEVALDPEGARHQLLIGPRGIGKTHLLSLVANRVRIEADSDAVTLAWMEEDPWGVGSYEKFLAAILAGVADERSDSALAARAAELHATRDESGRLGEEALREAVGESRLVLLVENLDDVFQRIGENGQERFRAFVEDWRQMLVVATAQQLFEGVQLHESPFYGFFAITRLEELSLDSATELMRRIAELRRDQDLVRYLRSDTAKRRLAAVEALAGGHPRIWLLLSGCVSIDAIDDLVPLFLEALDDLTPYYQDRLRELGHQQQELVVQLSEAGGALSNRALAERSGIAQNQVATSLGHLAERGYVRRADVPEKIASGDARLSYWELREPLMRLCLDVKQARGKPLRMVVEFLRAWYGPRLLDELVALPPTAELANTYVSEAFRTLPEVLPGSEVFRGSAEEILARAEAGLGIDPEREELQLAKATVLVMEGRFAEAREFLESHIATAKKDAVRVGFELQLIAARRGLGEIVNEEAVVQAMLELSKTQPDALAVQEVVGRGLGLIERDEDAIEVFERAIALGSESPSIRTIYGRALARIGRLEQAIEVLERALEMDPTRPETHVMLGFALRWSDRLDEALNAFDRALELDPDEPEHYRYKAGVLDDLARYVEALDIAMKGLEVDPENPDLLGLKGGSLFHLERYSEALEAFAEASRLAPGEIPLVEIQGLILRLLDRPAEALEFFQRVSELNPDSAFAWSQMANVFLSLGRFDEGGQAADRAVRLDPQSPATRFGLSEVSFVKGDFDSAVHQLREALALWRESEEPLPGDTTIVCAQIWDRWKDLSGERDVIDEIAVAYDEVGAAEDLGLGLVESARWLAEDETSIDMAEKWVDAWESVPPAANLQIPLQMLRAAVEWKKDHDRAHLLALPPEQREILVGLLAPGKDDDDSP